MLVLRQTTVATQGTARGGDRTGLLEVCPGENAVTVAALLGGPLDGQLIDTPAGPEFAIQIFEHPGATIPDDAEAFIPTIWVGIYRLNRFGALIWQGYPEGYRRPRLPLRRIGRGFSEPFRP